MEETIVTEQGRRMGYIKSLGEGGVRIFYGRQPQNYWPHWFLLIDVCLYLQIIVKDKYEYIRIITKHDSHY